MEDIPELRYEAVTLQEPSMEKYVGLDLPKESPIFLPLIILKLHVLTLSYLGF